jgi:hypothetical protein
MTSTPPAATAVIQKLPFGVDLQAVGDMPSGISWITCFRPSGVRRTTFKL